MKKTLLVALLNLLVAVPAFAHEKLGLDAAGQAKLEQTFEKYRAQLMPLRKDARETRRALTSELSSAQPNETHVASLTGQLQSDRQQMMAITLQRAAELKEQLTPTQYAKLMLAAHHRFGRRGEYHGGSNDGDNAPRR